MIRIAARRAVRSAADEPMQDGLAALYTASAELARVVRGMGLAGTDPAPTDDPLGEPVVAWADDDYLYFEVRLPDDLGPCIDVSSCGRTLMARIARDAGPEPPSARPPGGRGEASPGAA